MTHHHLLYEDLAVPLARPQGEKKSTKLKGFRGSRSVDSAMLPTTRPSWRPRRRPWRRKSSPPMVPQLQSPDRRRGQQRHFPRRGGAEHPILRAHPVRSPRRGRNWPREAWEPASTAVEAGSFLTDSLPKGPDYATLIRIADDHDDLFLMMLSGIRRCRPLVHPLSLPNPCWASPRLHHHGCLLRHSISPPWDRAAPAPQENSGTSPRRPASPPARWSRPAIRLSPECCG